MVEYVILMELAEWFSDGCPRWLSWATHAIVISTGDTDIVSIADI
jgi:hypothetical protein